MKKQDSICGCKLLCRGRVPAVRNNGTTVCLLVPLSGDSLLDSFVAYGSRIAFALQHDPQPIFLSDNVHSLVVALCSEVGIPPRLSELFGTESLELHRVHGV